MIGQGARQARFDKCLYFIYDGEGKNRTLVGVIGHHVDDFLGGGRGPRYEAFVKELRARFPFRRWSVGGGDFCGSLVSQDPKTKEVSLRQAEYVDKLKTITIPKGTVMTEETPENVTAQLRAVWGSGNWLANQTRPDLCIHVSQGMQQFP